jgi:hypothetical protein
MEGMSWQQSQSQCLRLRPRQQGPGSKTLMATNPMAVNTHMSVQIARPLRLGCRPAERATAAAAVVTSNSPNRLWTISNTIQAGVLPAARAV